MQEATEFSRKYDIALPFVDYTHKEAMKWAARRGFVETLLGRKQRFSLWEPPGNYDQKFGPPLLKEQALEKYGPRIVRAFLYAALNRKLQASAADVMKKSMVDAYEAGVFDVLGAPMLTVHDELDVDNPCTEAGEAAVKELQRQMEIGFPELVVPLLCDRSSGKTWGECG